MQYVRYLEDTPTRNKGDIRLQPLIIANHLVENGIAELCNSPEDEAEYEAYRECIEAEQAAMDKNREHGLSELEPVRSTKKKASRVRRAVKDVEGQQAALTEEDKAANEDTANNDARPTNNEG